VHELVFDSDVVSRNILFNIHNNSLLSFFLFHNLLLLIIGDFLKFRLSKKLIFRDFNLLHKKWILLKEISKKYTKLIDFIYIWFQLSFDLVIWDFIFCVSEELGLLNLFLEFFLYLVFLLMNLSYFLLHFPFHFLIKLFNCNLASFLNDICQFNNGAYNSFLNDIENSK